MNKYPIRKRTLRWKRILLKLSGEAVGGKDRPGIDIDALRSIVDEIKETHDLGCQIALVIGGGNFIRGKKLAEIGIERTTADYMGMLATTINALALQNILEQKGLRTNVLSAITSIQIAEPFVRRRAIRHLENDHIVIFSSGTGNPYFTTDTAAALRASEVNAEILLKASTVEGVYEADPKVSNNAKMFKTIDPATLLQKGLHIMDLTAVTLSMENKIPIIVFNAFKKGNLKKLVLGEHIGTEIKK